MTNKSLRVVLCFTLGLCLISGVIAVVIFVSLAALAVIARFLFRRKESFQTQDPNAGKTDDSPETPFTMDPNTQNIISENQKEYFIWGSFTYFWTNPVKLTDWEASSSLGILTFPGALWETETDVGGRETIRHVYPFLNIKHYCPEVWHNSTVSTVCIKWHSLVVNILLKWNFVTSRSSSKWFSGHCYV